jgi:hypothetical protein
MIIRTVGNSEIIAIAQESHADISAQFAAHWGNDCFARLEPYQTMVFGTTYHDSGHRELEADLPIDPATGAPFGHRAVPPELRSRDSDGANSLWIRQRDPYAALLVSMHHAGLRKRRYDTVSMSRAQTAPRPVEAPGLNLEAAFGDLSGWQAKVAADLHLTEGAQRRLFWHNYQMLQVFDVLSLYLCCDGYDGDDMVPMTIKHAPVHPASDDHVDIAIEPVAARTLRFSPFPLDTNPLDIGVMARQLVPAAGQPDTDARDAYYGAPRVALSWHIVA